MPTPKTQYPIPEWGAFCPSLFRSLADRAPRPAGWEELWLLLRGDARLRQATEELRAFRAAGGDCSRLKGRLPAFSPAASLEGGHAADNLKGLTGASMVDFDGIGPDRLDEVRRRVQDDPHTLLCYTTAGGSGLRVIFRYEVLGDGDFSYRAAWQHGNEYYAMLAGVPYDAAVKDATRLSFMAHDPDARYNPGARAFGVLCERQARRLRSGGAAGTEERFDLAWRLSLRAGHRWEEGSRHLMMLDLARLHCRLGLPQAASEEYLAARAPRGAAEARDVARWCYATFAPSFGTLAGSATDGGQRAPAGRQRRAAAKGAAAENGAAGKSSQARYADIAQWLAQNHRLRQNEVRRTFEYFDGQSQSFRPLTENMRNTMMIDCDTAIGRRVRRSDFDAVLESAHVPLYNPFVEYLESLPPWDGSRDPDYIGRLCSTVRTTSPPAFFHKYFEKWFVSLLPSMLDRDTTNQMVLIFTGPQGTYKSTFFRELLPPELRDYFLSKTDPLRMDKDARLALSEFALICLEEIGTMTPRELDTIKGIITQTIVTERAPYQHSKESRPHIASFCGTSNETALFGDRTGLRRWLAFEIVGIDPPDFDYRGLYSQALYLYRNQFRYWFDPDDIAALAGHMEQFKEVNLEEEQILRHYRLPRPGTDAQGRLLDPRLFVSTAEILERCSHGALRGMLNKNNIGRAMRALGFEPYSDGRLRGFLVCEVDPKESMDARTIRR